MNDNRSAKYGEHRGSVRYRKAWRHSDRVDNHVAPLSDRTTRGARRGAVTALDFADDVASLIANGLIRFTKAA